MESSLMFSEMTKSFSVHFNGCNEHQKRDIIALFGKLQYQSFKNKMDDFAGANPFLQGNSGNWAMIEFWTENIDRIILACQFIEKELNTKIEGL